LREDVRHAGHEREEWGDGMALLAAADSSERRRRRSSAETSDTTPAEDSVTTILVADDNRDAVDVVARLLEAADYSVIAAYSVRQALDLLDERPEIDLVLSDIRMPEIDGFDFLRVLRHRFPSLPIVLITGLPLTDEDVIPTEAVILEKPFAIEDLERVISERLGGPRNPSPTDT
jgi:CheY-like chemotaxis protein